MTHTSKFQAIVLAAGKGTRMKNPDIPKALIPFAGEPLIKHLIRSFKDAGMLDDTVIVVGYGADQVKSVLRDSFDNPFAYVFQKEQLGTGHAVSLCESVGRAAEHIIVMYGDHPLVSADTLRKIQDAHVEACATITMAIAKVDDFSDWRSGFFDFGRVIRNQHGHVTRIIEKKDASDAEKQITEVNPSYFCFRSDWLWENIKALRNENAQREYYLTDLVGLAFDQGIAINSVVIPAHEALGVNTPEQLANAEKFLLKRK